MRTEVHAVAWRRRTQKRQTGRLFRPTSQTTWSAIRKIVESGNPGTLHPASNYSVEARSYQPRTRSAGDTSDSTFDTGIEYLYPCGVPDWASCQG